MDRPRCDRCRRRAVFDWRFAFALEQGDTTALVCLSCAVRQRSLVRRASRVALVVGVILTAINQGDAILAGHLTASHLWKIPLTFLVPYLVSAYSTLGAVRCPTTG